MIALAVYRGAVNLRPSPSTDSVPLLKTQTPDFARLLGITRLDADPLPWLHVEMDDGTQGYTRADVTYVVGDLTLVGGAKLTDVTLATAALKVTAVTPLPVPVPPASGTTAGKWASPVTGALNWNDYGHVYAGVAHEGVDLAAPVGTPIVVGGAKGVVIRALKSAHGEHAGIQEGYPINSPAVLNDPGWGWGLGNHAIVRYAWADLPGTTQSALVTANLRRSYVYVAFGHMKALNVGVNQVVDASTVLGQLGYSGNVSGTAAQPGAHCHLECRLSNSDNPTAIFDDVQSPKFNPNWLYELPKPSY